MFYKCVPVTDGHVTAGFHVAETGFFAVKVIGRWVTFRCIVLGILNKLHYIFGVFGGILGYYGYFLGYYGYFLGYYGYFGLLWGVFFQSFRES